jgi:hypothetical protein
MGVPATALASLVAAALAAGGATAAAAMVASDTPTLGSSSATTSSCDTDGVAVTDWVVGVDQGAPVVNGATLDDVSASCQGKTVTVTFADVGGQVIAQVTQPAVGGSQSLSFAPIPVASLHTTSVGITG